MIRTLIFDLGNTLVPFSFDPLQERLGSRRDTAFDLARGYEIGTVASDEFSARMCALAEIPAAELADWWCTIFTMKPLITRGLLRELKSRVRLGLLSNTNELHFRFLASRLPELAEFDFLTLSYEVGAVKPEAEIYADAEAKSGCRPDEILYFDDIPEYVEAARKRGWNAEVFRGEPAVSFVLRREGLLQSG
jgi:HAD superfamily hydrolase (TIGR01509 family)